MKRVWGHVLAGLSVLAGVASVGSIVSACVHDDSTIFVDGVLAPQFVTAGMACTYTADPTQLHITGGVLDVGLVESYTAEFLVGNQIVPRGDPNQPDTETSFVNIQGAVVRILDSDGKQLTTFTQPAAITIPPSSGTSPGYAPISLTIIDPATALSLGLNAMNMGSTKRLIPYTRFFGKTLGGDSVESNEFGFPVDVCWGCLVTFSAADVNPTLKFPNCAGNSSASASTSMSVPCTIGQDFAVDCSQCSGLPCRPNEEVLASDAGTGTD
ncbi:MAG TPA: hypothetical protein VII82_10700 [Polyangiaceae bacterium]